MSRVFEIMRECGALLTGHFLLSSGRHSGQYCQCAKLFINTEMGAEVMAVVAKKIKDRNVHVDKIVGPAMGGILPAYELASQLGKPNVFTERVDGKMALRRGFTIEKGEKVLIVEDVVTTGKSSLETAEVIRELGGEVIGIACVIDRKSSNLDLPIYSAEEINIESYDAEECPICKEGKIEIVKPGSRKIK
ncbi:orotate phosphoribosyltransferase [Oceanirhabdus sp. W0125-5]|uniref:orotate phosphoribosyltransferase n=1 Tax=Oceanirhabdus sp. W0125-5 TaxID=2999116 RepID=UPI0022F31E53|nr:orotate phosphoribosyltransferase [Oceanirhabdus sp. W0125-5]WBW98910.1 orotate phosphoribosyltransferase [Oceanirhabdus sp. W0125-5]